MLLQHYYIESKYDTQVIVILKMKRDKIVQQTHYPVHSAL